MTKCSINPLNNLCNTLIFFIFALKISELSQLSIEMKYKRILLKLSGEALMGSRQYGIDPARLKEYATEIKEVVKQGVEVAIVIGGGNIFRGVAGASNGMDRVQGDYMGMLATVSTRSLYKVHWKMKVSSPVCKQLLRWKLSLSLLSSVVLFAT